MTVTALIRTVLGLRQRDVAERLGVSPTYIQTSEIPNRRCDPSLRKRLAEVYGIDEELLFDGPYPRVVHEGDAALVAAILAKPEGDDDDGQPLVDQERTNRP